MLGWKTWAICIKSMIVIAETKAHETNSAYVHAISWVWEWVLFKKGGSGGTDSNSLVCKIWGFSQKNCLIKSGWWLVELNTSFTLFSLLFFYLDEESSELTKCSNLMICLIKSLLISAIPTFDNFLVLKIKKSVVFGPYIISEEDAFSTFRI